MTTSIPAFHVSGVSKVTGKGEVFIASRQDASSAGTFAVELDVHFISPDVYPVVTLLLIDVNLSDSLKGVYKATSVELINSFGKHNPTVYLTGRCALEKPDERAVGLRYWLLIANNKPPREQGTPDIVGFAIHDRTGARIAYGTGPVRAGDFNVIPE